MQKVFAFLFSVVFISNAAAQTSSLQRPKLVVGLVVDQMRWDFLYRYYDRYDENGGFKRMLNQGFTCENTFIPYAPTVTACGHASIYTGTVPAINGITGNYWWDNEQQRTVYCTEDKSVKTVGSSSNLGQMSPANMLTTTICDELRLATNFRSKVIGISIKDRGGILPAGHSANAAYWYDNTVGDWISSTYYMTDLPKWVKDFNGKKLVDKYYAEGWKTLYPINTYLQSTADENPYEGKPFGNAFPYDLKKFIGKSYGSIATTPWGNTYTAEFAKAALEAEQLGADDITDFLAVSFSSPDYIGHTFGPNSIEQEDNFLRLDKLLGEFLDFLDNKVGKGQYTVFLSADHGVSQIPGFLNDNRLPGGRIVLGNLVKQLNLNLKASYGIETLVVSDDNYQLHLNYPAIDSAKLNKEEIIRQCIDFMAPQPGIARVFAVNNLIQTPLPEKIKTMLTNGYYPRRNGDVQLIFHPNFMEAYGNNTGTTHGLWNPYDAHIPLLWYGWGIKQGKLNRETYMMDIAPTLAALLRIEMPSGSVGTVIEEVMK